MTSTFTTPALVGVGDGPLVGQRFDLPNGHLVLGRSHGCFLYLDDPGVGPRHAALTVNGTRVSVRDLDPGCRTFVNGRPIDGVHDLRPGDLLRISGVEMRFDLAGTATSSPAGPPPVEPPGGPDTPPERAVVPPAFPTGKIEIDRQIADRIYNIEGSVTYHEWRESLLRTVAAARSGGRRLVTAGATLFLVGGGVFAAGVLGFISQAARGLGAGRLRTTPFGPLVLGIPSGVLGFGVAMIGSVLIVIGIVRHVTTVSRRRHLDAAVPPRP